MKTVYYVSAPGRDRAIGRGTQKRQAIRTANKVARYLLRAGATKRDRTVSVRIGKPKGKLLYQCHALKVGNVVRIVREEL